MGTVLLIFGLAFLLVSVFLGVKTMKAYVKNHKAEALEKKEWILLLSCLGGLLVAGILLQESIIVLNNWAIDGLHRFLADFGAALFLPSFACLWSCFYLHYWKTKVNEKEKKIIWIALFVSIAVSVVTFLILGEGAAPYLVYPLISGIAINGSGIHFFNYQNQYSGDNAGGIHIAWYGVIIVFAALVAFWISDHRFYQRYHKHGIIDTGLLIAFPAGIIGARIWYIVGNWNGDVAGGMNFSQELANGNWMSLFAIWEGGLTILGGAVGGIIGGVIYMMSRRKYVDIRFAMDTIIPTILLAQAIGRWGNFFNHEVYGVATPIADWPLLPTWLKLQMSASFANGASVGDTMYVPLFLIEALINTLGYFVIVWVIPYIWTEKRGNVPGTRGGFYLAWYGVTRMIMEPLRDPTYNMGSNGAWSFWNAMVYIILGALMIGGFLLFAYERKKRGLPYEWNRALKGKKAEETPATEVPSEESKSE